MLTNSELKSQVDDIWDRLWSAGLSLPTDSIEQFSYLLFLKRLDDEENKREKQAKLRNKPFEPKIPVELRWSHWRNFEGAAILKHVRDEVFPWLRSLGNPQHKDEAKDTEAVDSKTLEGSGNEQPLSPVGCVVRVEVGYYPKPLSYRSVLATFTAHGSQI